MTAALLSEPGASVQHAPPGVLFAGNFQSGPGGALSVCEDLSNRLARRGWPIITVSRRQNRAGKLADMVSTAWRRRADYRVAQIDVFSGAAFVWAEAVAWTARRAGKPFVLTLHGGNLPAFAKQSPARVQRLMQAAAVVTAPSAFLREEMRQYRDDIVVLPNALTLDAYAYRLRSTVAPSIVWVRALHDVYNPTLVPRVLALLQANTPNATVTMAGPDKGDGSLQRTLELADTLGVRAQLRYVGGVPKSEVPVLLDQADIFLNTTNIDNTPVSVSEALASGLCIVSTAVGGIPYLLRDDHDALLVPPNDAPAAAEAIGRILFEPGLSERLSRAARARAEELEWSHVLPRWDTLLRQVAGGARG